MFEKTAQFYDLIYSWKDYEAEARQLHELISRHKKCEGNTLLEAACGTGAHVAQLCEHYTVEGLDLDPGMVDVARERCPDVTFHEADMVGFDLGRRFDAITCLFSSIGYVRTLPRMKQAIQTMADHLKPGGVLIVEPWFSPDEWNTGNVHSLFVDQPDLKIARINTSEREGNLSFFVLHYLVGTPEGVEYFTERHELGLFTKEEYLEAFRAAGLNVTYDEDGLMGRGLYIGTL